MSSQQKDDIGSLLGGKTINIYVGRKRKHFAIHQGLLWTPPCAFIANTTDLNHGKISEQVFLPDENVDVFEMFVAWLYSRKVKAITPHMIDSDEGFAKDHALSMTAHVDLYLMAETRNLTELKNLTMDRLREYSAAENTIIASRHCGKIYGQSKQNSPLRKYMVEQFLAKWFDKKVSSDAAMKAFGGALRMDHGEQFVADMFNVMRSKFSNTKWPSPNQGRCRFHDHEGGDDCDADATKK